MSDTVSLDKDQLRLLIALQYLNASEWIFEGLKQQHEKNIFHFAITLRSFIEYTRRGMWFLCSANTEKLKEAMNLTFESPGSPGIETMDEMINEALGQGRVSHLMAVSPGINEPFLDCLHALTHGNPISVRMISFGLDRIFNARMLLARAEVDLGLFRIMLYRRMLGEKQSDIWKMLSTIHNRPADVAVNVKIAAHLLKESGKADKVFAGKGKKDQKSDPKQMTEGTAEALEGMLSPRVEIAGIAGETDSEKVNALVFELYKEALSVVNLAAHLLDEAAYVKGGWPRNQAICAGLMIRIAKFMLVVTQLSAKRDRAEAVSALNRSIMESAINLEFLVKTKDDAYFDQFVKFSLAPERELYDAIQANVAARGGEVWPIEQRMLESINDVSQASGVKIEEVNRKYRDWGGGLRERLKALNKEEQYVGIQRIPSHAVHGTWVDLYKNHLDHDSKTDVFSPHPTFSLVDARALGPIAIFVLEATKPYLERFFSRTPASKLPLERIDNLRNRVAEADAVHEKLMAQEE